MGDLPEEIDIPDPSLSNINVKFLPLSLESVDIYIDNIYNRTDTLVIQDGYRVFSHSQYLPLTNFSTISYTSTGYDYFTINAPFDSSQTYIVTLHPAVDIPNVTINGSDYWNTHKSEYNALIGNPVGTFKIDLSEYATNSTISITDPSNLYNYVDINGNEIVNYTVNKDSIKNIMVRILPKSSS